ncbi:MAG: hypothetical protein M3O82_06190 [Verrucomicrobiota bacterium]|nr:hypothetical protein [Verrucomicrobiota bacterium]
MATSSATDALRMYVNDMVALEKHILEAIERQVDDSRVKARPEVFSLVEKLHRTLHLHVDALENHAAALGGGGGATVKAAVTAVAGTFAGIYDKIRKDPVSRMLRDDYTALSLATISYTMLTTTGIAFREETIAGLAERHLRDYTPIVVQLSEIIPPVVADELRDEDASIDSQAGAEAVRRTHKAWTHDVVEKPI